jgi:hypothetical protein
LGNFLIKLLNDRSSGKKIGCGANGNYYDSGLFLLVMSDFFLLGAKKPVSVIENTKNNPKNIYLSNQPTRKSSNSQNPPNFGHWPLSAFADPLTIIPY